MVLINGEAAADAAGQTLLAVITKRQIPIDNVVVELNGQILHRPEFPTTILQTKDQLELISFVGGGR